MCALERCKPIPTKPLTSEVLQINDQRWYYYRKLKSNDSIFSIYRVSKYLCKKNKTKKEREEQKGKKTIKE